MLRSDHADDRKTFRAMLLQCIIQSDHLRDLPSQEQQRFFELLSALSKSLGHSYAFKAIGSERTRRLRKLASDSRRLKQAIQAVTSSDASDGTLLDDYLQHTRTLAAMVTDLDRASSSADSLAEFISKQRRNSTKLFLGGIFGGELLDAFDAFSLPCATRHDYDTRLINNKSNQSDTSKRKRNYDHLPSLDCEVTLAMRCALLTLFDARVKELDWGNAVTLINAGKAHRSSIEKVNRHIEKTSFEFRRALMRGIHALGSVGMLPNELGGRLKPNKRKKNEPR